MNAVKAAWALGVALCAAPLMAPAQAEDVPPTWDLGGAARGAEADARVRPLPVAMLLG